MNKLPNGWFDQTIGDLIKFEGGSQPPKSTFIKEPLDGYIRLIQIRDYKTDKYATYIPKSRARKFCTTDDVMIGRYGPPLFQILRGLEGAYNVAMMKAVPSKGLEREYMYYYLNQGNIAAYFDALSQRTGGQTGIEMDRLKNYPFPLPPLPEQRKIAEILSTWDEAITKTEDLIAALQTRKKGLMQKLLTGKVRFPGFEGEWKMIRLGDLVDSVSRKEKIMPEKDYSLIGVKWYVAGVHIHSVVSGDKIATEVLSRVEENDILYNFSFR